MNNISLRRIYWVYNLFQLSYLVLQTNDSQDTLGLKVYKHV